VIAQRLYNGLEAQLQDEYQVTHPLYSQTTTAIMAHLSADHFTKTFNIEDTAVVLIDHQIGTCGWVHSIDKAVLEKNVKILATFATEMKMPLVLTSSMYNRPKVSEWVIF
jgi:hypothetical protein